MALKKDSKNTFVDDGDPLVRDIHGDAQFNKNLVDMNKIAASANIQGQKDKLALQNNLGDNQIRVGDAEREFQQDLQDATVRSTNLKNARQQAENNVYDKTGMRIAMANTENVENDKNLNLKYKGKERQLGLDMGTASMNHLQRQDKMEADLLRIGELNKGGAAGVANDASSANADAITRNALADTRARANFSPFAWNVSSGDVRRYNRDSAEILGDSPNNTLQNTLELLPGVAHGKSLNIRSRMRDRLNSLAAPK